MQHLQGSGFWAALLIHKRYRSLNRAAYTRTPFKFKYLWLDYPAAAPACTFWMQQSCRREDESMHLAVQTCLHAANVGWRKKQHPALYYCLLIFAEVSSAIARSLQVAEETHYPLLKVLQPAPVLIGTDLERILGTWKLERICFLHITGTANTVLPSPVTAPPSHTICFLKHLPSQGPTWISVSVHCTATSLLCGAAQVLA